MLGGVRLSAQCTDERVKLSNSGGFLYGINTLGNGKSNGRTEIQDIIREYMVYLLQIQANMGIE
ncbi:MAG: hypothetical protein IPQ04_14345 [Saprospiraceae bacterium]|nr:hypothetical protein [Saprospiraceae bacterium]